jgi:drug/metabolite transporter (DMT)-like permease
MSADLVALQRGSVNSVNQRDSQYVPPYARESYHKIGDEVMEATSFHQIEEDKPKQADYLLFEFKRLDAFLGDWTLLFNITFSALFTVGNAFIVQLLQEKFKANTGEILFFRSLFVVIIMIYQTRKTDMLSLSFGRDRETVLINSITLSAGNIAFIMCLSNISIAGAFSLIVLINPLSVLVAKNCKFRYTQTEIGIFLACIIGISVVGIPWGRDQFLGVALGLVTLLTTYFSETNRNSLLKEVPLIKLVFLSNLFTIFLSVAIVFVLKVSWIHLISWSLILLMTFLYLLALELIHRINSIFNDDFVHIITYLYILFGFLADFIFRLKNTNMYDLLGSIILVFASFYGKNGEILRKFRNIYKYGSPMAPQQVGQD